MPGVFAEAADLFEVARASAGSDADLALAVGQDGSIRILNAQGWSCHAIQVELGARTVYHITRASGRVRLEARSGLDFCVLEGARREPATHRGMGPASSTTGSPDVRMRSAISPGGLCVTTTCPAHPSSSSSVSVISRPTCGMASSTNLRLLP